MKWNYHVEEVSATANTDAIEEEQLAELGGGGWEAVTSWAIPGDPHVNQGAWKIRILLKQPSS